MPVKTPILLIGGGGHCRSCIDVIELTGLYKIVGIIEANNTTHTDNLTPYSVVGFDSDLPTLLQETPHCLITVGQVKHASLRQKLYAELSVMGAIFPAIISPLAYVSPTAKVGSGTIVMHQALINAYAQVGENGIINSQALIEHDCVIANHVHVSTGASINGSVSIGEGCLIGCGAVIKQGVTLADQCIIGAGSLVLSPFVEPGTYTGLVKSKK